MKQFRVLGSVQCVTSAGRRKKPRQGEPSGLGPCVHTLGAQPLISLSWGAQYGISGRHPWSRAKRCCGCACGHMVGIRIFCLGELGYISLLLIYTAANLSN